MFLDSLMILQHSIIALSLKEAFMKFTPLFPELELKEGKSWLSRSIISRPYDLYERQKIDRRTVLHIFNYVHALPR